MNHEKLPRELVWEGEHLSELGLTALADGQEAIVDTEAVDHAAACPSCATKLGHAALLSEAVGQAVASAKPDVALAPAAEHAPQAHGLAGAWRALLAGLTVALLAGGPLLARPSELVSYVTLLLLRGVPVLARGGYALVRSDVVMRAMPLASIAASALFVTLGLMIARARSDSFERSAS